MRPEHSESLDLNTAPKMTTNFSLLVVDDEPDLRTLYELTLLREGYDVESAGSVDEEIGRAHV